MLMVLTVVEDDKPALSPVFSSFLLLFFTPARGYVGLLPLSLPLADISDQL